MKLIIVVIIIIYCGWVSGSVQRSVYSGKELDYAFFVHSLCVLGKLLIYTNGRKLFPIKVRKRKGTTSHGCVNSFKSVKQKLL